MQDDGAHQSLENEHLVELALKSQERFWKSLNPTPTPYTKQGRAACVGTKNLFLKDPVQTQDPKTCCRGRS